MPESVGLDVEESALPERAQLVPCQGVFSVGYGGGIDEDGHRDVVLPGEREHVAVNRLVRVVLDDHHRLRTGSGTLLEVIIGKCLQGSRDSRYS